MEGAVVTAIADLAGKPTQQGDFIATPDGWTLHDPASLVKPGPSAKTLGVSTLGAVRDYLTANKDALDITKIAVHVVSPASVHVLGPIDARSRTRETFLQATATDSTEGFLGKFMPLEDAVIGLQVIFAESDDRRNLLKLLSNVKHEQVKTASDDGISQTVSAKIGVVLQGEIVVPNPITLTAFRSFRDVAQSSCLYVIRVQSGHQGGFPTVALFEADGGAWKLNAIEKLRDWLKEALPIVSVLA